MNKTLSKHVELVAQPTQVSADVVIFTILDDKLQVLLCEGLCKDSVSLPGEFIRPSESLEDCAARALKEQTGITDVYLEQLYTFGQPDRYQNARAVSVAYYALIPFDRLHVKGIEKYLYWHQVDELPDTYLDHAEIIQLARCRLQAKLEYSTIVFQFMPQLFTLSELQKTYEVVMGHEIDKRNFRKRVLALEHVKATNQTQRNGSHRPARLYQYTARDEIFYLK